MGRWRRCRLEPFYEGSTSLFVRAYDAFFHHASPQIAGDVAFYESLAREAGGPVLEIACGTGRIALTLAEHGLDITGVDASGGMLAIAQRKVATLPDVVQRRISLVAQDMCELNLQRTFGCIFVAFRSFQHLLTIELQRKALAAMRHHLAPGGRLALHLFDPRLDLLIDETMQYPTLSGIDPATQRRYAGEMLRSRFDHVAQVRRDLWRYTEFAPDGTAVDEATREMALRWTYRWELHHLLELCGFSIEAEYSDFTGSPPAYGKELIVVVR